MILGASFIGMEVAASLRERGLDVTVIGREAVPSRSSSAARWGPPSSACMRSAASPSAPQAAPPRAPEPVMPIPVRDANTGDVQW